MKTNVIDNGYLLDDKVNFYKKILNHIPDLIFQLTISPENEFYFSYLNKSILSFFDVSDSDLKGNPKEIINNKLHPDDRDLFFDSLFNSKRKLISWDCEFRVQIKNNGLQWFKVDANVEKDLNGNTIFYCNLTNITSIKKREIKVQESETRYQFALEASKKVFGIII